MVYAMNITSVCCLQLTKLNNVSCLWSTIAFNNVKFNSLATFGTADVIYKELLALFCFELLTVNLYDCVHYDI